MPYLLCFSFDNIPAVFPFVKGFLRIFMRIFSKIYFPMGQKTGGPMRAACADGNDGAGIRSAQST
jgi:hypothetical protein